MASNREERRPPVQSPQRPALEEAPTVLTRNPFHLDEKLTPLAENDPPSTHYAPSVQVTPLDDQTHVSNRPLSNSESSVSNASPLKMGQTLEGQRLGHFELEKFVGGGGMGAVFRALDTMLGRVVAVKILSRERTDADTLRRFKNEAQSAARLDHKNIARVHYVGEDRGWNYIVFEFIDGINVRDMVEEVGPLDVDDALHFTMQIAEALDHASQREVVHRDIKPSNIIITNGGRAKLVDMGLARLHQVESSNDDITASGVTLGTFDYISPEQARDPRAADVRSDIYSLGCTLYFMLCGRPPFPEGTVLQKLLSHNSDRPPDLQIFRPDVPDDIVDVVNRMLAKQPSQRYQTPAELMSELVLLAQKYQLTKVTAPAELWSETKPSQPAAWERHIPWMAPLIILLLSVLLLDFAFPIEQPNLSDLVPAATASPLATPEIVVPPGDPLSVPNAVPAASPEGGNAEPPTVISPPEPTGAEDTSRGSGTTVNPPSEIPSGGEASASPVTVPSNVKPPAAGNPTGPVPPVAPTATASVPDETPGGGAKPTDTPELGPMPTDPVVPATPAAQSGVIRIARDGQSDAEVFARLDEAIHQAAVADDIEEIQLAFNGTLAIPNSLHVEAPLLQIAAAPGYQPELRFEPAAGKLGQSSMITFRGTYLSLAGLRLTMVAPNEITREGWAMIHGAALAERIEIRDSALTFNNPLASELEEHGAAFIRLQPLAVSRLGGDDMAPPVIADTTDILLQRCLVRGSATFLHSQPGKAVRVDWDQGLLATSQRMLDIENAVGSPSASSMVRLALTHVTAVTEKGLCRMGANSEPASHPLTLNVELTGCVVRTASDAPLVETLGIDFFANDPDMLFILEQSGTRFSRTRIRHKFGGREREERLKTDSMSWKNPVPASKPWHQHTYDDYIPVASPTESASTVTESAGFDAARLPRLSAVSSK